MPHGARHCARHSGQNHDGLRTCVAYDEHVRLVSIGSTSRAAAHGLRVEVAVLVLCRTVPASVRGTVRDRPMLPASATRVRCSIRGVGLCLWEGCLHGTAIGLHQLPRFPKSTLWTPLPELCPHSGRFEARLGSMANKRLGARLRVEPCKPGPGLHQSGAGRAPTPRSTGSTFSRPCFCVHMR